MGDARLELSQAFKSGLSPNLVAELPKDAVVERRLRACVDRARQTYPTISVSSTAFVASVARRLVHDQPLLDSLDALAIGDLWLAFACLEGDDVAWELLDEILRDVAGPVLGRFRFSRADNEEILQRLRASLFAGEGNRRALLAGYRGKGNIAGWLRVILIRRAIDKKGSPDDGVHLEAFTLSRLGLENADPELRFMRSHYVAKFRDAFKAALDRLPEQRKTVLHYHLLGGLNMNEIAVVYQVHRHTVERWLADIRTSLLRETERQMTRDLGIGPSDMQSVLRLIRSRLDVTFSGILTQGDAGRPD